MSFIPKNPLTIPEVKSCPSTPPAGTRGIFAKEDGWYEVDANNNIKKFSFVEDVDDTTLNSLIYYGDADIVPSDSNLFEFITDDKTMTATIKAKPTGISGDIVIPYEYVVDNKVYKVTTIGDNAFMGKELTSVVIPCGVTTIKQYAFCECLLLANVIIPDTLTIIEEGAFYACESLTNIVIPDSVTKIGNHTFYGCLKLSDVKLSNNIAKIENGTFKPCANLINIEIPDSVTEIDCEAFAGCLGLKSITIGSKVTRIESGAFYQAGLSKVYFKGTKTQWDNIEIHEDNESLLDAKIYYEWVPTTKGYVDAEIAKVSVGDGSITVDSELSETSENPLQNKVVTEKLNELQEDLGVVQKASNNNDQKINSLKYYGDSSVVPSDKSLFAFLKNSDGKTAALGNIAVGEDGNALPLPANLVIPYECNIDGATYTVTTIRSGAFYNKTEITSVILPNTITTLQPEVFANCTKLSSIKLPDSLTTLAYRAFSGCPRLSTVIIPEGVTTIEYSTFENCGLFDVTLPVSIMAIKQNAFKGCPSYANVYYAGTKTQWDAISIDGSNTTLATMRKHYGIAPAQICDVEALVSEINSLRELINSLKPSTRVVKISLIASAWVVNNNNQYSQEVSIADITPYSKVDLQPTTEQLLIFYEKDITFVAENDGGTITVYCIGQKPTNDYEVQATITEVDNNE